MQFKTDRVHFGDSCLLKDKIRKECILRKVGMVEMSLYMLRVDTFLFLVIENETYIQIV
jgi:hypothetical protein